MTEHGSAPVSGRYSSPPGTRVVGRERQQQTGRAALTPGASRTATPEDRSPGAALVRVADRLRVPIERLIDTIPPDTLRRTRYPVREIPQADGTTLFEHDLGIVEGRRSSVKP